MPQPEISTEEALQSAAYGFVRVGVPIDNAISAFERLPSHMTLRIVVLASVPDREAAQKQFDCLRSASDECWLNVSCPEYTAQEIREASLAMVTRTIASLTDC